MVDGPLLLGEALAQLAISLYIEGDDPGWYRLGVFALGVAVTSKKGFPLLVETFSEMANPTLRTDV
jgi:hypothetical protein